MLSAIESPAMQDACDSKLLQPSADPNGYRMRGDRCEGVYVKEVAASSSLSVVSLTQSFQEYNLSSGIDLRVAWDSVAGNDAVHLRATALPRRVYYRMDAVRPPGSTSYLWKTGVLAALNLGRKDVGVVGWVSRNIGSERRDVYLPLRITQSGAAGPASGYQLVLYPGADLNEVFVTLTPVGADRRVGRPLLDTKPLRYGYYPAERAFAVPISGQTAAGIYVLDIGATLRDGRSSSIRLWFYQAGKV